MAMSPSRKSEVNKDLSITILKLIPLTERVVLAADGLRGAGSAARTDDGDGGAVEADEDVGIAQNNAKQTEDRGGFIGRGLQEN